MENRSLEEKFKNFVLSSDYPCLGAKSAFNNKVFQFGHYSKLGTEIAAESLAQDLRYFISKRGSLKSKFTTLVAVFGSPMSLTEEKFEKLLWHQLSLLHQLDNKDWNENVSSDTDNANFGFSFNNTAFFIVGLHNNSSRFARRFAYPTLIFNAHDQFDYLRQSGKYSKMQAMIRKRDTIFQGFINPMVADFGTVSEARQYSGRKVSDNWMCPFHQLNQNNGK